ncbi:IclR family transcriptional regulator [Compostimonas suwonensis]|uniref:IclR family acetate operon transcriptional repressor n=1 Tax=Compostimonas suwonensis TaxID=1048394 RepID=A0A2M9C066_9MICO|nr:IclR family transcriptional regulator [Compostimonas suwonensis]PJJ63743.1 IclR family acetate operon transcriptional repressor [Compostimonas suwonensis]
MEQSPASNPSAAKILDVLFAFSMANPHPTALEVANAAGINRTTAHRLLQILEANRIVRRRPGQSSRYELSARVLQLSETFLHQLDDLRSISLSYLTTLRDRTGETAALHLRQGDSRVGVVQVESYHQLRRTYSDLGKRVPLYLGAPSLAMLAFLPQEQIDRYVPQNGQPWPDIEFRDAVELFGWLADIREKGFAVSRAHRLAGIVSIAAPIRSRAGDVIAAINVTGPEARFTPQTIAGMAEAVVHAACEISERIGYSTHGTVPSTSRSNRTDR